MREILFRGKLKSNAQWAYGNLQVKKSGVNIITPDDTPIGEYGQVDPSTVGQYTGLTDKNGKRIFEGDIVEGFFNHEKIRGYVFYSSDATFFVNRKDMYGVGLNNASDWVEVIGNIYDNPELLKEA